MTSAQPLASPSLSYFDRHYFLADSLMASWLLPNRVSEHQRFAGNITIVVSSYMDEQYDEQYSAELHC